MPSLLGKKFSGPVARPMWPFYASGIVILYGVNAFASTLAATDEYKNDPRNPLRNNQDANNAH